MMTCTGALFIRHRILGGRLILSALFYKKVVLPITDEKRALLNSPSKREPWDPVLNCERAATSC